MKTREAVNLAARCKIRAFLRVFQSVFNCGMLPLKEYRI